MPELSQSDIWNKIYTHHKRHAIWPWTDLVQLVMRYASPPYQKGFKVLELGCGAGANIPFFASLEGGGVSYFSVESSEVIVSQLHETYPQFRDSIEVGDFTTELPNEQFDLIVDRGAMICNKSKAIARCIQRCYAQLNSGGKFIGVDWYSTQCSSFAQAQVEDEWTRVNFVNGPFVPVHRIHFSDKEHLLDLFSNFEIEALEHKTINNEYNENHPTLASWNFVAVKV